MLEQMGTPAALTSLGLLIAAAGVTVATEVGFMALVGYRRQAFLLVCGLVNLISNLALNLTLALTPDQWRPGLLPALEVGVVVAEWAVLRLMVAGPPPPPVRSRTSLRLALATVAANALSYSIGLLLF